MSLMHKDIQILFFFLIQERSLVHTLSERPSGALHLYHNVKEEIILKPIAFYILNLFGCSLLIELEERADCGRKVQEYPA